MKLNDLVTIKDGSYAVRVDSYEKYASIGLCKDTFKILQFKNDSITCFNNKPVHDVIIQNTVTKKIYLHSKAFITPITLINKNIKEVTIEELNELFNCTIKIVSDKKGE